MALVFCNHVRMMDDACEINVMEGPSLAFTAYAVHAWMHYV